MSNERPTEVLLKDVRLSFPHLFEKSASVEGGKEKFRASFIINPEEKLGAQNIAKLDAAQEAAEMAEFKKTGIKYKDDRCCYRPGEEFTNAQGEVYGGYEDMVAISCANDRRPTLIDRKIKGQSPVPLTKEDDKLYGGCRVDAVVRLYCVSGQKKGGNGMFATVEAVMFRRDDESFGGAGVSADAFDEFDEDEFEEEDGDDEMLG